VAKALGYSYEGEAGNVTPITGHGGLQGCEASKLTHFLDTQLTDGGEVVSLTHHPPFTPERFLVLISTTGCVVC
jgi:hypothetical protein